MVNLLESVVVENAGSVALDEVDKAYAGRARVRNEGSPLNYVIFSPIDLMGMDKRGEYKCLVLFFIQRPSLPLPHRPPRRRPSSPSPSPPPPLSSPLCVANPPTTLSFFDLNSFASSGLFLGRWLKRNSCFLFRFRTERTQVNSLQLSNKKTYAIHNACLPPGFQPRSHLCPCTGRKRW